MPTQRSIPIEVLSQLWERREAMNAYIYLAINADEKGNFVAPPSRKLAKDVGLTRYSLDKSLETLTNLGLVNQISTKSQPNFSHATTIKINALSNSVNQISTKSQPNFNQSPTPKTVVVTDGYARFLAYFNEKVARTPIKQIRTLSEARKNAVRSIFKEFGGKETVEEALDKVIQSRWCCGENSTGWTASFDWIFKKSNFIKILEGNYDNRPEPIPSAGEASSPRRPYPGTADRYSELESAAEAILRNAPYRDPSPHD